MSKQTDLDNGDRDRQSSAPAVVTQRRPDGLLDNLPAAMPPASTQLEHELALMQTILNATTDGILVVDTQRKITHYNRKLLAMWRCPESLMEDDRVAVAFVLDQVKDPAAFSAGVRSIYDRPDAEIADILELRDGRVFERYSCPQRMGDTILGRVWNFRDVTERQEVDDELRLSRTQLLANLENTPNVGIQWYDEQGRILYWNSASETLYDWKASETLGKTLDQLIHTPEEAAEFLRILDDIRRTGKPYGPYQVRVHKRDGTPRWVLATTFGIPMGADRLGFVCMDVDITDRCRAEEELSTSRILLQTLIEHTPAAIAMFDRDMRYLAWSKRWISDYRLGERDLKGLSHYEVFPEIGDVWKAVHRRCLAGATESHEEDLFIRADGTVDYVRWVVQPWRRSDGEVGGLVMFTEVITDRLQAARALRESEERFQAFMNQSPVVAWVKDNQFKFRYVNSAFEKLFQLPAEQILGRTDYEIYAADFADRTRDNDRQVLENEATLEAIEHVPGADGIVRHWLVQKFPLRRTDQQTWVGGTAVDVTERLAAEAALRASEARYRAVVEHQTEMIIRWKPDGRRTFANEAYLRCFGLTYERAIGSSFLPLVATADRRAVEDKIARLVAGPVAAETEEHQVILPDGTMGWQEWTDTAIRDAAGQIVEFQSVGRDVTERKRAEDQRRKLEAQILHAQKLESLGVLAGGIAHDFNNLLTSMLGNANLASMRLPESSPVRVMLAEIEQAAKRAADLTQQMLAYSGKGTFAIRALHLDELIMEMITLLKPVVSKKAVINLDLKSATLQGDPTQIRQVVMNLITNASDALGDTVGTIQVRTGVRDMNAIDLQSPYLPDELPAGAYAYVEVEDTGCGMSQETMNRIFDPFFSTKFTGRGLGLAAVLGIIRSHRGTIQVTSRLALGTSFQALFPWRVAVEEKSDKSSAEPLPTQGRGTILIIEDEAVVSSIVQQILELKGFRVYTAENGYQGLEMFTRHRLEIVAVLTDLTMPRMDGLEVLQHLRLLAPDVPVLLMSGYPEQDIAKRFPGSGARGFLQKPFDIDELMERIYKLLPSCVSDGS